MTNAAPEVQLSVESRFENIELVQVVLEESLGRLQFDEDSRYWIGIAVREALANAIKHGNQLDPAKRVDIALKVDGSDAIIEIQDQGPGFELGNVENPLEPENLLKPDGRGIFYMNRFMDDIEYDFRPDGTIVTLRKRMLIEGVSGFDEEGLA